MMAVMLILPQALPNSTHIFWPVISQLDVTWPLHRAIHLQVRMVIQAFKAPAVAARLGPDYANLLIVGVHTSHVPNTTLQFEELSALSKRLGTEHGPMIVTGDFNATSQSRLVQDFGKSLDLTQAATLPTFPAYFGLPQLAIHQMMVRSGIVKLGPQTGGSAAGSDHIPIARSFAIPTSR